MEPAYIVIMKIDGPSSTSGTKGVSKSGAKKGAGATGFGEMISDTAETQGTAAPSSVMSIQGVDALLSLQGAEDGTSEEARRKARLRGEVLLDQLDKLRIGLLTGGIPVTTLQQLKHAVNSQRAHVMDPELNTVLDEIELRVLVELAKHEQR
jgi:hypothetical protein